MAFNRNPRVLQAGELLNPTLSAIRTLGGSARNNEITEKVIELMSIPDSVAEIPHKNGSRSELEYRLAWARTLLKSFGVIDNLELAVWSLTAKGQSVARVDPNEVYDHYKNRHSEPKGDSGRKVETAGSSELDEPGEEHDSWRTEISAMLLAIPPDAFERLCQRVLRVSGFTAVEVTGKSGDGGIDGHGLIRFSGLISFPVMFQCKRYKGNVPARDVRDFRGAMQGRAEKGLILTTGGFTPSARDEATRDGAPPIDLIDGELLLDLLKDLRLGVKVTQRVVDEIEIVPDFFESI